MYRSGLGLAALLAIPAMAHAQGKLIQVHQDFSQDPGWEWKDNRIVAKDPPMIEQDFGWAPTNHTGNGPGEIGGRIWMSRTPAYYAIPLNRPLSFKEPFSFTARIAFLPTGGGGAAYLGFFNHALQGWRAWNSMAVRLGGETGGQAAIGVDAMTADWRAVGWSEGFLHVPADGEPHTIAFSYDPAATPGDWPDARLQKYMTGQRQTMQEIFEQAHADEPDLTREELWDMLVTAHAEGLIEYLQRTGHESIIGTTDWNGKFWFRKVGSAQQGAMIVRVDDSRPFKYFIVKAAQDQPVYMDRFGLFNLQMYHRFIDLYLSDLTVNGHKVDLSKDPAWEGRGNRVRFQEQDFQRQDYGYSETNWAGDGIGEVGGQFTSAEPVDPLYGYYADDVGALSLDDSISFSGNVCYASESTDAGMFIGFFRVESLTADLSTRVKHIKTSANSMGILVEGSSKGGKFFMPQVTTSRDTMTSKKQIAFRPLKKRQSFTFKYDPHANNNQGRITVTLEGKTSSLDLTEKQRAEGATLDRFGVTNLRAGGKFVEVYFDDLTYTARRPENHRPMFHRQQTVEVPYPPGGRKY